MEDIKVKSSESAPPGRLLPAFTCFIALAFALPVRAASTGIDFTLTVQAPVPGQPVQAQLNCGSEEPTLTKPGANLAAGKYPVVAFNTFFDARLTSTGSASLSSNTSVSGILANKQAAALAMGACLPIIVTRWDHRQTDYSLYVAPVAKAGFYTAADNQTQGITTVNPGDFYKNYGYRDRVGHYREYRYANGDMRKEHAPEQLSYPGVVVGRWGNFEYAQPLIDNPISPNCLCNAPAPDPAMANCLVRERLWRYGFEGFLQVPNASFIPGLSANIAAEHLHQPGFIAPPADLRFLIGVRFDGKTLLTPLTRLGSGTP
jgi:hypothetical protein